MEVPASTQVRVNVVWLWMVAVETVNSGYAWEAELKRFAESLDVSCREKGEAKMAAEF